MEGDKATLDQVLYTMDFMVKHFKSALHKYATNPKLCNCIWTSWHAFDKYYLKTDKVAAYSAALLLAPHQRKAYIDCNWKATWRKPVVDAAQKLWVNEYKGKYMSRGEKEEVIACNQEPNKYNL